MKFGDILENKSAGRKNPHKRIMFLREDVHYIYSLNQNGIEIKFNKLEVYREKFLSVVGSVDLSGYLKGDNK